MDEYKISLKEPNIEYKYQTVISIYYFKLLETQVNKIENNIGADEEYNKILGERPTYDTGRQLSQGFVISSGNVVQEARVDNENKDKKEQYKTDSSLGSWFGYFGDKINNVTEYFGINSVIQTASNGINNSLEALHLKNTINKAVDYTKSAGEFVIDKAKEISQNPMVNAAKEKITETVGGIKDTAVNMIKNTTNNSSNNNP